MSYPHDPVRRAMTSSLATLLAFGGTVTAAADSGEVKRSGSHTLVAYFSRTGNTRVIAGLIQRALGTDLFEIRPAKPYPEDYLETVEQARQERDGDFEPALETTLDTAQYHTVFIGFPIWGETTPPVIRTFLSTHDLSGKTLIPFVTHGGYGLGNSQSVLASHAPKARLRKAFVMQADQERQTMEQVTGWLKQEKELKE